MLITKRKRIGLIALVGLAALAGLAAVAGTSARWWTRPSDDVLLASGSIEATEVAVSFKIPGRVIERPVDEGDRVAQGDLVGRLESKELEADVERLRASLQATETRVPQLRTEVVLQQELTQARIADAQATLAAREARLVELKNGSRPQDLQKARAEVREAKAVMENAQVDVRRMDLLFREGFIAEQARDVARTTFTVAAERHQNALEAWTWSGRAPDRKRSSGPRQRSGRRRRGCSWRRRANWRRSESARSCRPSRLRSCTIGPPCPLRKLSSTTLWSEARKPVWSCESMWSPGR
jgi:HlyD family secretion protein